MRLGGLTVLALVMLAPSVSNASLIIYGTHTDDPLAPGASLSDVRVRMQVDMVVLGGLATITFSNVSVSPETSAVFKEIVLDTYDDDTATAVLWNGQILTNIPGVMYTLASSNGLPGYQQQTSDPVPLAEFRAEPSPVTNGIGPGESLQVRFNTSLPNGSGIEDYLAFFDGGADRAFYSIGFHAISADVVNGQSLSGTNVPEPGAAALIVLGAAGMIIRRRRRYAT